MDAAWAAFDGFVDWALPTQKAPSKLLLGFRVYGGPEGPVLGFLKGIYRGFYEASIMVPIGVLSG